MYVPTSAYTAATSNNVAAISSQVGNQTAGNGQSGNVAATSCQYDILPSGEWFALMGRCLWQFKAGANIACLTGYPERTARSWVPTNADPREPPARALALLLRSKQGAEVIEWIMHGYDTPWWVQHQRAERVLKLLRSELKE